MKKLTVLVTGGAGFIGSHLTRRLVEEGCVVSVLDNLQSGRIENLASRWDLDRCQRLDRQSVHSVRRSAGRCG